MNKPIWQQPISLEALNDRGAGTMSEHLGMVFTKVGDDYLTATMPVDERTKQPLGLLNGGASCALAETVGSTAANYCVDQDRAYCVGLDINANHVRSARQGYVEAIAKPVHLGAKTQVWEIRICNEVGALVCLARLTMMVMLR
jgi:1,4-dihydroxy-2-naphthoyl-CoA hydrolase